MGKTKSCSPEERRLIYNMVRDGKSYSAIAKSLSCSKTMVFNAMKHIRNYGVTDNVPRKKPARKTSAQEDR